MGIEEDDLSVLGLTEGAGPSPDDGLRLSDDQKLSSPSIIMLGSTAFAVGLFWLYPPSGGIKLSTRAKNDLAGSPGYDLFVVRERKGVQPTIALGSTQAGQEIGTPVLALCLADKLKGDWIVVHAVSEDTFYLVVCSSGTIHPSYELVCHSKEELLAQLHAAKTNHASIRVYAPASLGIADSTPLDLISALGKRHKYTLTSPQGRGILKKVVIRLSVLGLLLSGVAGYYGIFLSGREGPVPLIPAASDIDVAMDIFTVRVGPMVGYIPQHRPPADDEVPPVAPWVGRMRGEALIKACTQAILAAPIYAPQWSATQASCTPSGLSVDFSPNGGTSAGFEWFADKVPGVSARSASRSNAMYRIGHSKIHTYFDDHIATATLDEVSWYLDKHLEERHHSISIVRQSPDYNSQVSRYFDQADFTVTLSALPTGLENVFKNLGVFLVNNVSLNISSREWTVNGTVVHRREKPLPRGQP